MKYTRGALFRQLMEEEYAKQPRSFGGPPTIDKTRFDRCRSCGQRIEISTHNGRMIGQDISTLERHPCRDF